MIVLGIGTIYHDPSACILVDGKVVAAAEEERFSRNKHALGEHPLQAIEYCLKTAGLKASDIDVVAHPCSPETYKRNRWRYFKRLLWNRPAHALKAYTKGPERMRSYLNTPLETLRRAGINPDKVKLHYVEHHVAHAASAYYFSGFRDAAIMTIDGMGELASTTLGYGKNGKMHVVKEFSFPDSLGFFYSTMTDFLGFEHMDGEYKLMGMAPFGDASKYNFDDIVRYADGEYRIHDDYVFSVRRKRVDKEKWYSKAMVKRFGPPREGDALSEPYIHLAAATQKKLEDITIRLIEDHLAGPLRENGGKLCFSGGCALNVKLNKRIIEHPLVSELWVQPASSDAGIPLGAAALVAHEAGDRIETMKHAYLGPDYSDAEIEAVFSSTPHKVSRENDITETASRLLNEGKILAWFQGRMEWGPRALGNRSILGNPSVPGTSDKINEIIKFRENWRPFCPSILKEYAGGILTTRHDSPFMTFCFEVNEAWRNRIPEIVHVDGTARPQYVTRESNPVYYELIDKFRQMSGLPLVINTSLNRRGEPMVCSPEDALRMFEGSGLRYLAIGNFLIEKDPSMVLPREEKPEEALNKA